MKERSEFSDKVHRLVVRFGVERVFRVAAAADTARREAWFRWCGDHPHDSGTPGIYRPEAMRQSRRQNHAHNVASEIYHTHNSEATT